MHDATFSSATLGEAWAVSPLASQVERHVRLMRSSVSRTPARRSPDGCNGDGTGVDGFARVDEEVLGRGEGGVDLRGVHEDARPPGDRLPRDVGYLGLHERDHLGRLLV